MKINLLNKLFLGMIALSVVVVSCEKDDDKPDPTPNPNPTIGKTTLKMHFHNEVNGEAFVYDQDYEMNVGNTEITYSFNRSAFYVSGITLTKLDGGTTTIPDSYLYVTPETKEYEIGEIDEALYTRVSFNIGVDTAANAADPTLQNADHPLAPKNPSMHWSWNTGYIFMALEGNWSDSDGSFGTFVFHIGLDELLRTVNIDLTPNIVAQEGKPAVVHMNLDYAKIISAVDLRTENFSKSMSPEHKVIATKLADAIPSAFEAE